MGAAHREYNQANRARNARRNNDGAAARGRRVLNPDNVGPEEGELDEAQRAWIRQFVQLALIDEEDIMDLSDSDDDAVAGPDRFD